MSDNFSRLIPTDPAFVPDPSARQAAISALVGWLPDAGEVTVTVTEGIEFVDSGSNFESVLCPVCAQEIPMEAWQQMMGQSFQTGFTDLGTATPCCETATSLNELRYESPAGFARFVLQAMNPNVSDLSADQHAELERLLGTTLRRIWTHY